MPRALRLDLDALSFNGAIGFVGAVAVFFLVAPTIIVVLTSFTSSAALRFPPDGYSLRWYLALVDADQMQRAALTSLVVASLATAGSVVLGATAALGLASVRGRWTRAIDALFMSPLLLPALAFGFAGLIFFNLVGYGLSLPTLIIGHVVVCVPFVVRTTLAALTQLDPALIEASRSLGAGWFYTVRRVTLPIIARGVGAGAFLAFMASFDNVPVSLFLSDARTEVLPIHLWEIIETNLDVRTAAASGVLIVFTVVVMVVAERFAGLSKQLR
jgi:putative spermidine/putrescine transport system permease protein